MDFQDVINKRASIRKYKDTPVTDEQFRILLEAGMKGPSGKKLRAYRFIVAKSPEMVAKIKATNPYARYNAPNLILVIGQKDRSPNMWQNDCGAATENILLQAAAIGLGTCWCAMCPFPDRNEAAKALLKLPENEEVYSLILVGVPDEEKGARGHYEEEKVTVI